MTRVESDGIEGNASLFRGLHVKNAQRLGVRQSSGAFGSDDCSVRFERGGGPPHSKTCRFPLEDLPPHSRLPVRLNFREAIPNMR